MNTTVTCRKYSFLSVSYYFCLFRCPTCPLLFARLYWKPCIFLTNSLFLGTQSWEKEMLVLLPLAELFPSPHGGSGGLELLVPLWRVHGCAAGFLLQGLVQISLRWVGWLQWQQFPGGAGSWLLVKLLVTLLWALWPWSTRHQGQEAVSCLARRHDVS